MPLRAKSIVDAARLVRRALALLRPVINALGWLDAPAAR